LPTRFESEVLEGPEEDELEAKRVWCAEVGGRRSLGDERACFAEESKLVRGTTRTAAVADFSADMFAILLLE